VATFAQPIDVPARQTIDAIGTSLNDLARYGFYTFNLDIYIDTDRQAGSGSVSMLPGRKAGIDPATAWEKAIVVTPDPGLARSELRRLLFNDERREMKAGGEKMDESTMTAKRDQLRANVEAYTFFPERIRIIGSRVEFFVPADFLGGGARPEWAYVVAVSGADLVHRMDQRGRLLGSEVYDTLFILPVQVGRPLNAWGTNREDAENQPLIIDLIVPPGAEQKQILGDFAGARSAVIPGVVPGP
jgi:hypothetical protein